MLRRNIRSDFVAGAYVFPGGALDAGDGGSAAEAICSGRDDVSASRVLGLGSGGLAYWVAAARECFEEAGLLLAAKGDAPLSLADPHEAARFAAHRRDLNAGRRTFPEVCEDEGLVIPADRMHYFAHWITPEGSPRRYDTRFFVAAAPAGQTPAHDASETVADVWVRPADALALHREGQMELILPTIRTLQAVARFATVAGLLEAAEGAGDVPTMAPRMVMDDEGVRLLLPGDPGYDDPGPELPAALGEGYAAAVHEASRRANAGPPPMPDTARGPAPEPGRLDVLAPGLARLTAPNPGVMTGPGTNTYLVGSGDLAVVDPGPDDPGHVAAIEAAAELAGGTIRWVLVTHTHPDHAPAAHRLAEHTRAQVVGFGARDGFVPDVEVTDGWTLEAPSFVLTAVHTPGHASNHLCWLLDGPRILLSGDHVMDRVTVVVAPPDGDMGAYLTSLRRLLAMDPPLRAIAPGHGRLLETVADVVSGILAHRLAREELVVAALAAAGTATARELVARVYADVDSAVHPIARASLWAHLRKLVEDGRAVELPGDPEPAYRGAAPGSAEP